MMEFVVDWFENIVGKKKVKILLTAFSPFLIIFSKTFFIGVLAAQKLTIKIRNLYIDMQTLQYV